MSGSSNEYMRNYMRKYWRENPDKYEKHKERVKKYHRRRDKEKNRRAWMKSYRKLKSKVFKLLGNRCSNPNCAVPNGMNDSRCLQIDHVHGGGIIEMKKFKCYYSYLRFVLDEIRTGSKNYQLLCANCNWIKRFENKEHKLQP